MWRYLYYFAMIGLCLSDSFGNIERRLTIIERQLEQQKAINEKFETEYQELRIELVSF